MKKIIDKNGRLFGVISIIDVAVLLVVAVMALALYVRGNRSVTGTTLSDELISFQMVIEVAPDYLAESVQVGDFIYDKERVGAGALGEIKKVELLPTGGEDCYNVLITAQGKGIIADGRFTLNRVYEMGANAARMFYTKYSSFTGVVTNVWQGGWQDEAG